MKKIVPQTKDITSENIHQIAKLFPQVITEKEDENGNTIKGIDFESLKQHLSKDLVETSDERYRLDWPGKRASILKANTPITSTLKPDRESSVNFDTTENIYIEGDNFEVLKILQESYLGKVKMIYIDPPYNTGKDFVYRDNFKVSKDDYETELGTEDEEGGKLFKNTDTNGRFHSDWLSMMYERLSVARDLLTDDGVIFMSIDDNEVHNLRKIGDEVFGEENFRGIVTRPTGTPSGQGYDILVNEIDYLLVYAKTSKSSFNGLPFSKEDEKIYDKEDIKGRYLTRTLRKTGGEDRKEDRPSMCFGLETPDGNMIFPIGPTGYDSRWRCGLDSYKKLTDDGLIEWEKKEKSSEWKVYQKFYLEGRLKQPSNLWKNIEGNKKGSLTTKNLLGGKFFDSPKPVGLIERCLRIVVDANDLILDFFSGSATTAHATMRLNAEDGGNRKFIMVQLPEQIDETSEAFKAGYKTIPEIGKERIRRAGKKILAENVEKLKERDTPLDVGFRVYKTAETILKDVAKHPDKLTQTEMFASEDNIKEDATSEDILTAVLLDFGEKLDNAIETKTIAGSEIFIVDENALVACFSKKIDMQVVDVIAKMQPIRAVFRDACFKDDKDLINTVESRFKQVAPNTKVHVI
jgi:adenine-specific DNA-methyltransferase